MPLLGRYPLGPTKRDVNVIFQFTSWNNFSGGPAAAVRPAKEEDLVGWRDGDSCMVIPLLAEKGFDMTR